MLGEIASGTAIAGAINAIITARRLDRWAKLLVSCTASGICTLCGVTGAGLIAHITAGNPPAVALILAFGEGLLGAAAVTFNLWRRSDLTKGVPLTIPRNVEEAEHSILENQGIITIREDK